MVQRLADNDKIVTRYMDDLEFQNVAFPLLARDVFAAIRARESTGAPPVEPDSATG